MVSISYTSRGIINLLMTSVPNNETDVVGFGELNRSNDIGGRGDVDGVAHVVAEHASLRLGSERVTALVGKVGLHHGRRRHKAIPLTSAWFINKGSGGPYCVCG